MVWPFTKSGARRPTPAVVGAPSWSPADDPELFDEAFLRTLEQLHVAVKRAISGGAKGARRSRRAGHGLAFRDHRRYAPGDDFKHIDWLVYARLGRLLLRLYEEEEDLDVHLLVDASASMAVGDGVKLRHALRIAAALGFLALANLDRAAVAPFSDGLGEGMAPVRGKGRVVQLFDALRSLEPTGGTHLEGAAEALAARARRRGLVVVVSDLYATPTGRPDDSAAAGATLGRALDRLRHRRLDPFVVHVTDRRELSPQLAGEVAVVDCESGRALDLVVTPGLLDRYRAAHESHRARLEATAKARSVPYVRADVGEPFEAMVLELVRRGGFL